MSKKNIGLLLLLGTLGAIYIFNFTSLFQKQEEIQITSKVRPMLSRRSKPGSPPVAPANIISFSLNNKYALTSVRVVEESDFKTNKYPHAIWHLVSEESSVPTKTIVYGMSVDGMKSKVPKLKAETLKKNIPYVLLLEAGDLKGQTTFQMR